MARYIDMNEIKFTGEVFEDRNNEIYIKLSDVKQSIKQTPTADVVEVKHGMWFTLDDCANEGVYCSVCHKKVYKKCYAKQKVKSNYCPNCGADMRGGKDENE